MKWEVPVTGREDEIGFGGVGIPEGKEATWKTKEQLKENINIDIQQIGLEGVDWTGTGVLQDRNKWWDLGHTVMKVSAR